MLSTRLHALRDTLTNTNITYRTNTITATLSPASTAIDLMTAINANVRARTWWWRLSPWETPPRTLAVRRSTTLRCHWGSGRRFRAGRRCTDREQQQQKFRTGLRIGCLSTRTPSRGVGRSHYERSTRGRSLSGGARLHAQFHAGLWYPSAGDDPQPVIRKTTLTVKCQPACKRGHVHRERGRGEQDIFSSVRREVRRTARTWESHSTHHPRFWRRTSKWH